MSKAGLLVTGSAAFGVSLACAYLSMSPEAHEVAVLEPVVKLGQLRQARTATAKFKLVNRERSSISILEVKQDCDCVGVDVPKKVLASGEALDIVVRWETRSRRGPSYTELYVISLGEDRKPHATKLRIEADVVPDYLVEPKELRFAAEKHAVQVLKFSKGASSSVALLDAYSDHKAFVARLGPEELEVVITLNPVLWPAGRNAAELAVVTNSGNEPVHHVRMQVGR